MIQTTIFKLLENKHMIAIIIGLAVFFAILLTNLTGIYPHSGGGPTATTSHQNDRPNSYFCQNSGTSSRSIGVLTASGRSWTASVTRGSSWITITNSGTYQGYGFVQYDVASNPDPTPRIGTISVDGVDFSVEQDAASRGGEQCGLAISPAQILAAQRGGIYYVTIDAWGQGTYWQAAFQNNGGWASASPAQGWGSDQLAINIAPNPGAPRMDAVTIGDTTIPIIQAGN